MDETKVIEDIATLKGAVHENTEDIKELKLKAKSIEEKQELMYEMNRNISLMAQSQQRMERDLNGMNNNIGDLSNEVSALKNAPAQESYGNLKDIKHSIISSIAVALATGVLGAVVGMMINK